MRNAWPPLVGVLGVLCCAVMLGCGPKYMGLPYYITPDFNPVWTYFPKKEFHQIPAFALTSSLGNPVTEQDLEGKWTVVQFFFSRCMGVCPRITQQLETAHPKLLAMKDVQIVSISLDPGYDVPEVLAAFREGKESASWLFLTGNKQEIDDLARDGFFVRETLNKPIANKGFFHTELLFLVDPERRIRGIYNGQSALDIRQLVSDLEGEQ